MSRFVVREKYRKRHEETRWFDGLKWAEQHAQLHGIEQTKRQAKRMRGISPIPADPFDYGALDYFKHVDELKERSK